MTAFAAHLGMEVRLALRKGETLLLTLGIPVVFLIFFAKVHVVSVPTASGIAFMFPGIVALSVMSSAMVSLSISTGFERSYGVLRRLYVTPLGQRRLIGSKIASVLLTQAIQIVVLSLAALLLGWHPHGGLLGGLEVTAALVLGSAGCAGIGLLLAGRLRAEVNLAASNGLYLILLLLSGVVVPLSTLPNVVSNVVTWLPSGAMAAAVRNVLDHGVAPSLAEWVALGIWSVLAPLLATRTFTFE